MLGANLWSPDLLREWWKLTDDEKVRRWPPYAQHVKKSEATPQPAKPEEPTK